ncbi:hypothetical protein [Streptomyces sp. CB03911]|uniref:hypothetical protein n=1 Tax=Streptomyces sp. CB03911 TaxID=1804758 RepID=UPI0009397465|nr:hypothetical protein [Streptomyces sp. CB03911]OKI14193.1 hypothetical protein A6A07_13660 [Streptomyces sp. CB03911]
MSTTISTPTAGAEEPKDPAAVDLTKTTADPADGDDDQGDAEPSPGVGSSLKVKVLERFAADGALREHLLRARAHTWSWLQTADLTDETLALAVVAERQQQHQQREGLLRQEISALSTQIITAKRVETAPGRDNDERRDGPEVTALRGRRELAVAQLQEHQLSTEHLTNPVGPGELSRARWARKAGRAGALAVAVVGGEVLLPLQDPRLLLLTLPAAAVALWRAGFLKDVPADGQPSAPLAADAHWPLPNPGLPGGETVTVAVAGTLPADPKMPPAGTFPIAGVSSPQWAGECIRRALVKEGVPVADLFDVQQQPWGWTCSVRISVGTPAAIIKAAADMETLLDLDQGRFIPTPTKRRAVVDIKVATEDPFAFVPGPPRRAPKSLALRDKPVLGYSMDARPLEMSLYGVQGAIIAGAGGGKSATIRTLAEYLTACRDTVVVCLDPSGVGLGPFDAAAALTLTDKGEIETYLRGMHQLSLKRPTLLAKHGMGTEWKPSEKLPALVTIADEWPQVTDASKESGVGIQLTGRKVCVQLLLASQFATADYVGSAIVPNLSLQILGPSRQPDVTATFGGGAIDGGWLAHRLVPKQADELNDVGKFYLRGGGYSEPVIWRGHWYDDETSEELAAERAAAGVLQLDEESLRLGGREFADLFTHRGTAAKAAKRAAATGDRLLADVVTVLRAAGLDRARTETLARLLQDQDPTGYAALTGDEVGRRLRAAGAGGTVKIGPTDGMANPNGYKLADLIEALDSTV